MPALIELVWSRILVPLGLLATAGYATFIAFVGRRDPTSQRTESALQSWAQMWIKLTKIDLHVTGGEDLDPGTSYVVVANHLSNYDIMICLAALPIPIRFLAKKELFKYPLLSQAMRAIGCVEVDRSARAVGIEAINRQAQIVRSRNHSLMIYAEGTRSRNGQLQAFKKGAFVLASTSGLPIVPVAISGTREIVPPGTLKARRHRRVDVVIGNVMTDTLDQPVPTLRDQTHAAVQLLLQEAAAKSN